MSNVQSSDNVSETGLSKNFKIPKRKAEDVVQDAPQNAGLAYDNQNVLANSYYNYQYPQMGLFGPWQGQAPAGYYPQYQAGTSQYQAGATAVATVAGEPITQKIYNTLLAHKEMPKTYNNNIFKRTVPDADDPSLPKELTILFQPLYCKLCSAQLSSNVMAKLHYKSKNHEKKIKKFLVEYSEKTGEPLHKRAKMIVPKPSNEVENDPRHFHCDVCDLPLTGKLHAESHYMGKNHQKAVMGHKNPAGKGFYNDEGKWVRMKQEKKAEYNGDDNFGLTFRPKEPEVPEVVPEAPTAKPQPAAKFHCNVCNVGATCQQQLEMHYKGQKHLKKMRQLGLKVDVADFSGVNPGDPKSTKIDQDILSAYRTPSGNYYCQICNLTLNSEVQFKVHLSSKNHHKKLTQQK